MDAGAKPTGMYSRCVSDISRAASAATEQLTAFLFQIRVVSICCFHRAFLVGAKAIYCTLLAVAQNRKSRLALPFSAAQSSDTVISGKADTLLFPRFARFAPSFLAISR